MKNPFALFVLLLISNFTFGQVANNNSLSVQIDGKEYNTPPRRIRFGNYLWITANTISPDKSLRIWFGSWIKNDFIEPGTYLIVNADKPDTKENLKRVQDLGKYKGIAAIKYVEETRSPRMEYHTGLSQNNDETIEVTKGSDGYLTATFSNTTLDGFYWKEKATATVFGGFGRLVNKMEDKATTKATGYDSDIDPEYNGYKKQDKKDKIVLKGGKFRLKIE
jgi:hypothetical protein